MPLIYDFPSFTVTVDDSLAGFHDEIEKVFDALNSSEAFLLFTRFPARAENADGIKQINIKLGPKSGVAQLDDGTGDASGEMTLAPSDWNGETYIGLDGNRHLFTIERVLTHELFHAVVNSTDPDVADVRGNNDPAKINKILQSAGDFTGDTVRLANAVLGDLFGFVDRGHYLNTTNSNDFSNEIYRDVSEETKSLLSMNSYTSGQSVENVVVGSIFSPPIFSQTINTSDGGNLVLSFDTQDIINTGGGSDWVYSGGSDDAVDAGAGNDTVYGGSGADDIVGGQGDDFIYGGDGDDNIKGDGFLTEGQEAGEDTLDGGSGDDAIFLGDGGGTARGGVGNDQVEGGTGSDYLYGGAGNDTLRGGLGADFLDGGLGSDILRGNAPDNKIDDFDTYRTGDGDIIEPDVEGRVYFEGLLLEGGQLTTEDDEPVECEPSTSPSNEDEYVGKHGEIYTWGTSTRNEEKESLFVALNGKTLELEAWANKSLGIELTDNSGDARNPNCDDDNPPDDFASPLVLDLDGDGIEIIAMDDNRVFFDIDSDGGRERTSWVGSDDGLLAVDLNQNGVIDDATELFGYGETYSGQGGGQAGAPLFGGPGALEINYESGFDKLSEYDVNLDGIVSDLDTDFLSLLVWRDINENGTSEKNELFSLADVGVDSLSLNATSVNLTISDSIITDQSTFTSADGSTREISDVWFRFDQYNVRYELPEDLSDEILALPDLAAAGNVKSLHHAMAEDSVLQELVQRMNDLTVDELSELVPLVRSIIYRWTGVDESSSAFDRGDFVDARMTGVIEAFSDTVFDQKSIGQLGGPNPRPDAGGTIDDQFNLIVRNVTVELIGQSDFGQTLFPEIEFVSNVFLNLESGSESGDFIARIVNTAPSDFFAKIAHFNAGFRVLDTIYGGFEDVKAIGDDGVEYRATIETVLSDHGIHLNYYEFIAAFIDGANSNSILTSSSLGPHYRESPVVVTGEGDDDIVLGEGRQIFYWGEGQGNDYLSIEELPYTAWNLVPRAEIRLANLVQNDVVFERSEGALTNDLVIRVVTSGETLTINNLLQPNDERSGVLVFGDGSQLTFDDLRPEFDALAQTSTDGDDYLIQGDELLLSGGEGDDILAGGAGDTEYEFGRDFGSDEIRDVGNGTSENVLFFLPGVVFEDLIFDRIGVEGSTLQIRISGTDDVLTIVDQFSDEYPVISLFIFDENFDVWPIDRLLLELSTDTAGNDFLEGTASEDTFGIDLNGDLKSQGDDEFRGYSGSDTYYFGPDSGSDVVRDQGRDQSTDTVIILFEPSELSITKTEFALTFEHVDSGQTLVVDNAAGAVEQYVFGSSGLVLSLPELSEIIDNGGFTSADVFGDANDNILVGTDGNDSIAGLAGDDDISGLDGNDSLSGGDGSDTLTGGEGDDVLSGGAGFDTLLGGNGNDTLDAGDRGETPLNLRADNILVGGGGDDILFGGRRDDELIGGSGNDFLDGDAGNDIFEGGQGDDIFVDTSGDSTYRYNLGDGDDLLFNEYVLVDTDVIEFGTGIGFSDLSFAFVQVDPTEHVDDFGFAPGQWGVRVQIESGGSLTIVNNRFSEVGLIEAIQFSDGTATSMQDVLDTLRTPDAADQTIVGQTGFEQEILSGGAGDDLIVGNGGNERIFFDAGDGNDTIIANSENRDTPAEILLGSGIGTSDIAISRDGIGDSDLVIDFATGDSITIVGQFTFVPNWDAEAGATNFSYADTIRFFDGATLSVDAMLQATMTTSIGNDVMVGSAVVDTFIASEGDDVMRGGHSGDVYEFNIGSGSDAIVETSQGLSYQIPDIEGPQFDVTSLREEDTLKFGAGITIDDLDMSIVGESLTDLRIEITGTSDSLVIENQFSPDGNWGSLSSSFGLTPSGPISADDWNNSFASRFGADFLFSAGIEKFVFDDGTEYSRAEFEVLITNRDNAGDNVITSNDAGGVLDGGDGDDQLIGGTGDDIYVLNRGYKDDVATDSGGFDAIAFGDQISPDLIAFTRIGDNGDDLLIEIGGLDRNSIRVVGQFGSDGQEIEEFRFSDGSVWTAEQVRQSLLENSISNGSDDVIGFNSDDIIATRGGDDVIEVRGGNDLVDGGAGFDVVTFKGPRENYEILITGNQTIVVDQVGDEGTNRLVNVESLIFEGDSGDEPVVVELRDNSAPVAGLVQLLGVEGTPLSLFGNDLLANSSDADGDGIELINVSNATDGAVTLSEDGRVTFTPDADFFGTATFEYTVQDAFGAMSVGTAQVNVIGVNDAPTVLVPIGDTASPEDVVVNFTLPASAFGDVDGDTLVYTATLYSGDALPSWLLFDADSKSFSGAPPENFNGSLNITVTVSDGVSQKSDSFALQISAVNDAPTVSSELPDIIVESGGFISLATPNDLFSDIDGDPLTISATLQDGSELPAWLEFDASSGVFYGEVPQGFEDVLSIVLIASDGEASVDVSFELSFISQNNAPIVATGLVDQTSAEDEAVSFVIPADTFSDVDGDALTLSASLDDGTELPAWLVFDADARSFGGTPPADFNGTLSVSVTASDGLLEVSDTFELDITPVNDAPIVATGLVDQTSAEEEAVSFVIPADTFSDVDGDALTLSASLDDGTELPAWLVFDADARSFGGTPPADFNGTLSVSVTASDGSLEVNDTFDLNITPVNDAPIASNDTGFSAISGQELVIDSHSLLNNDIDPDGDVLTIVAVGTSTNGTIVLSENGDVIYSPTIGFEGTDTFEYTVTDGSISNSATVSVTVESGNVDPYEGWTQGDDGRNVIFGDFFDQNLIYGAGGNDRLYGGFRTDHIDGGSGNDKLYGFFGDDVLNGDAGNDHIYGGFGNDTISGDVGNDRIYGGHGRDVISGGEGNDKLWGGSSTDTFVFASGDGQDKVMDFSTGYGSNFLSFGGDNVSIVVEGFNNFEDLLDVASQQGQHVEFDFGNGDELQLRHTSLQALDEDDFSFL